jgi:hypothetical protein
MRCKVDKWRFEQGTICPRCGFDNPVQTEEPLVSELPEVESPPKVEVKPQGKSSKKK